MKIDTKSLVCPKCFGAAIITESDNANNLSRLNEQASFRKPDDAFRFNFRVTCNAGCGTVFINKTIKNVKIIRS